MLSKVQKLSAGKLYIRSEVWCTDENEESLQMLAEEVDGDILVKGLSNVAIYLNITVRSGMWFSPLYFHGWALSGNPSMHPCIAE